MARLRPLPKVELHLHLEGSISQRLKNQLTSGRPQGGGRKTHRPVACHGFEAFLSAFRDVCRCLGSVEDLRRVVKELGRRLTREGVCHAEVFFSPQVHMRNGFSYHQIMTALEEGGAAVEAAGGPSLLFIADGVRQWGPEAFHRMVDHLLRQPSERVVAVGLGGDENSYPARLFSRAFSRARKAGLPGVVHAGEMGPAAAVSEALEWLRPVRIAHGIRAVDDPDLLRCLARRHIPLDVCLTSNCRTGATRTLAGHPLPKLLQAGVPVSLGTDDPALFRTTLSLEYVRAASLGVDASTLRQMARQSVAGSLLPAQRLKKVARQIHRSWLNLDFPAKVPGRGGCDPLKNKDRARP